MSPAFSIEGPAPRQLSSTDSAQIKVIKADTDSVRPLSREKLLRGPVSNFHSLCKTLNQPRSVPTEPTTAQSAPILKKREGSGHALPKSRSINTQRAM